MTDPSAADRDAFAALAQRITQARGFPCAEYRETCLRRRLAVRMRARGVHDLAAYAAVLDRDPSEYDRLLEVLTINVTRLFRNAEAWDAVAREVWPALFARPGGVSVWSAGCSTGEEPVSLAVSALEWARRAGADPGRLEVHATDIDAAALARARAATLPASAFVETPDDLRRRWFVGDDALVASPEVTARLRFARADLLHDAPPAAGFGLVVCRNVLIYFTHEAQAALLARFHDALAPGGFLLLGKVESIFGAARERFVPVNGRERLFRRAA